MKEIILSILAYLVFTFPIAYIWHLKWFKTKYEQWSYFGNNPSPPVGFIAILIQGIILAIAYSLLPLNLHAWDTTFWFIILMGIFHWSIHVVAAMAKNQESRNKHFFLMETIYLIIQFGVFGIILNLIYNYV